jgi:hypothetical protein
MSADGPVPEIALGKQLSNGDGELSISRHSGGVRHLPQADIESIRDVIRGYGSAGAILKELIQNAEDANARNMDLFYVPADATAFQSLLRLPGLLVVNDGEFKQEHRDAIRQISLGTKGTEERAIGRFGKGLKSVFRWCEAFFIIARTDRTDPQCGWSDDYVADLFNPWHGWKHSEWDEELESNYGEMVSKVKQVLNDPPGKPWFGLWFPLRQEQRPDGDSEREWIDPYFPGDDPGFVRTLAAELRTLAPSLVALRNLQRIAVAENLTRNSLVLEFSTESNRIPPPDARAGFSAVSGQLLISRPGFDKTIYRYCGLSGRLEDVEVAHLKEAQDWPKVVQNDAAARKAKGEPHFGTLISSSAAAEGESGSLDLRWSVFFPVGKQPADTLPFKLPSIRSHITVNLHGFFFLDSERLRIDGLDERFRSTDAHIKSCVEWNRIVASRGTVVHLPETLAEFAWREKFSSDDCNELAQAFTRTWTWRAFQEDICQLYSWRPRWRNGTEEWDLISASDEVNRIPRSHNPAELIKELPKLRGLSEELILVSLADDEPAPGLFRDTPTCLPEAVVLRLLGNAELQFSESTVEWINDLLSHLYDQGALTPAIRDRAMDLPLVNARNARTDIVVRLTGNQWLESTRKLSLFEDSSQTSIWSRVLCGALPHWTSFLGLVPPRWFKGTYPPSLNANTAAEIVLRETVLGSFHERASLVGALAPQTPLHKVVSSAIRFVMHGDPAHARDSEKMLFLPSTKDRQQIWSRLIKQLSQKDGGADSWRLLHDQWTPIVSQQVQREVHVCTVDASSAWGELVKCGSVLQDLEFPADEWSTEDICTLFEGLFQTEGQSHPEKTILVLRTLRLHALRGRPDERMSIVDAQGGLSDLFVLNARDFERDLPEHLHPLWESFLSDTYVVEDLPAVRLASTVQGIVFRTTDADGDAYVAQLDWNYVVRRSLDTKAPAERAPLIMEALSHGDQSVRGLGQKLKTTKWIPLALGGSIAPESVVHIEGLDDDLHRLLDPEKDGLAGLKALEASVTTHTGFSTLRNYLPRIEQALEMLGLWLGEKPEWRLGLTGPCNLNDLAPILSQLNEFENIPAAALVLKCRTVRIRGYDEGIDSLVKEHLLPAVLKSFDYSAAGVDKLETILHRLQGQRPRSAFDAYLAQACNDAKLADFLSRLSLVNQAGEWRPANQLIWPSTNLDAKAQLCAEQAEILAPLHKAATEDLIHNPESEGQQLAIRGHQLPDGPNFDAEAEKLREYLQPFRTGNVGDNLPAALVAVLGGNARTLALLEELLHAGIGMDRENFLAWLLGDRADGIAASLSSKRFLIEIVRGQSATAQTVTGDEIEVEFSNEINSLLLGDLSDLWFQYYYRSLPETGCHRLRLRWIQDPEQIDDCVAVFASTIGTILLKVHCNGVSSLCPTNLGQVLSGIADAGQTNLQRSRSYLLDIAEARLRELGVRDVPQLGGVLQKFSEAQRARVDAEILAQNNPAKSNQRASDAERLRAFAKRDLLGLLEAEQENATQRRLVDAIRRKMNDYQYNLGSILFELFQNADDAVAEIEEMQNGELPQARRFVLRMDTQERVLEVCHWGRPINHYEHPGFYDGVKRGYDQDLEKMLTLNFSDKGVGPDSRTPVVTGRFGLGFKSVFFLAQEPEVISGRLAFRIKAGFFPVPLSSAVAAELRGAASAIGVSGLAPTAIRLKWAQQIRNSEVVDAVNQFAGFAPLLPIFSRRIQTLTVVHEDQSTTWIASETKLTNSGRFSFVQIGHRSFFCFRCSLSKDDRPATLLFNHDASGISQLPQDWTGLWITTPTAERSDLRFALNAPFKPDAGRLQLAVSNPENRFLAEEVAQAWGEALVELFDYTAVAWDAFSGALKLHDHATPKSWWTQLWRETTRTAPTTVWKSIENGGQTLSWIAWGQPDGAVRRLVRERAAIPTELPDLYSTLAKQGALRFSASGLLAETSNGCFAEVSRWPSTQQTFPPGSTVHSTVAAYLRSADLPIAVEPVTLKDVFSAAIGRECKVKESVADLIGKLFGNCKSLFEPTSAHAIEVQHLVGWMKSLKLLAKDGEFRAGTELVCDRPILRVIERDEALRAAFAPDSAVLSPRYSDAALTFFVKTRDRLGADAPTLANWARDAGADKLVAVFKYLVVGELGQQLADQLMRPWLDTKRETSAWRTLSQEEQNEIERKFLRGYQLQFPVSAGVPAPEPVRQEMDPEDAFTLVSDWWRREQHKWVSNYVEKTYPIGFPGALPWPGDDEWDTATQPNAQARWLLLFIHAALVPLGFNMIGRDQEFSRFFSSKGWLDVLTNLASDPNLLITTLDDYLGSQVQDAKYHFQMRQFVAFYAVAKNLESLLLSLRETDRRETFNSFRVALSPRANPALTGTGIDAPPITGILGIGFCQLIRELYRLQRLKNPAGHRFAFTPIRKVRRLCYQLFGIPEGPSAIESAEEIFIGLQGIANGRDATFNHCFDLPLQFLAQYKDLRTKVLKVDFDVAVDDEDLDAAPAMDTA